MTAPEPEEEQLERAREFAYRQLARRDRTVAEIDRHLATRGVSPAVAAAVVAELHDHGYLDDTRFARRFSEDRRALDGWGSERIRRRLRELGVARDVVEAELARHDEADELTAALALLRRRFPAPPDDDRARARALALLVRRGYEPELAHDAIRSLDAQR